MQKGIDDLKAFVAGAEKKKLLQKRVKKFRGQSRNGKPTFKYQGVIQGKTKEAREELKAMKEHIDKKKEEAAALLASHLHLRLHRQKRNNSALRIVNSEGADS